jgi:hypothetical protein
MKTLMFLLSLLLTGLLVEAQSSYQWGFPGDAGYSATYTPISTPTPITVSTATPEIIRFDRRGSMYDNLIDFGKNYPKPSQYLVNPGGANVYRTMPGTNVVSPVYSSFYRREGNLLYRYDTMNGVVSPIPSSIIELTP